jgi:hypothetical protein
MNKLLCALLLAASIPAAAQDAASGEAAYPPDGATTLGLRGVW